MRTFKTGLIGLSHPIKNVFYDFLLHQELKESLCTMSVYKICSKHDDEKQEKEVNEPALVAKRPKRMWKSRTNLWYFKYGKWKTRLRRKKPGKAAISVLSKLSEPKILCLVLQIIICIRCLMFAWTCGKNNEPLCN